LRNFRTDDLAGLVIECERAQDLRPNRDAFVLDILFDP
jgi:hypothetical protein